MSQQNDNERLQAIFEPYAVEQAARVKNENLRFVHYTSADAAVSIIKNNCIWLRNSLLMNDYSEVQHGLQCLRHAWNSEHGNDFKQTISKIDGKMPSQFEEIFNSGINELIHETYILSISEHGDIVEDRFGRLSMWRAYGSTASVALVFHNNPFLSPSDALKAYSMPVFYGDEDSYLIKFRSFAENFKANIDYVMSFSDDQSWILPALVETFRHSVLSTKHPGFREEREWRVIYNPMSCPSDKIEHEDVSIGGIPQRVYKIPFMNYPDEDFREATLPEALKRLIIGPTATPYAVYKVIYHMLELSGVNDINDIMCCSNLPLRN